MPPLSVLADMNFTFTHIARRLRMGPASSLGHSFILKKPPSRIVSVEDVMLREQSGVFAIDCMHYDAEDMQYVKEGTTQEEVEGIPHYVMFNAGTSVLYTYPEALVITAVDRERPNWFFEKLTEPPYLLSFKRREKANKLVRQLFIELNEQALELPYSHPDKLAPLLIE